MGNVQNEKSMIRNKILWFNDLSWKHMIRRGLWKFICQALYARLIGGIHVWITDDGAYSIGSATPYAPLWNAGYRAGFAGYALWMPVLLYEVPHRVSDRSGTPQASEASAEYSGERDPTKEGDAHQH